VVDVVPQPLAFEVTRGSTAINSHPTQLNVSWRDRIVVVVFDRLPKKEEEVVTVMSEKVNWKFY